MTARLLALMLLAAALPALAVEPDEILDDPGLEARARVLSKDIRCLVCQNESIDSSNAEMAKDLRVLVRERLVAGDSDQEVFDYLVARYGDYVLLEPPMRPRTYLLWFGPALLLLLGGLGVALFFRGRRKAAAQPAPLTAAERRRIEALLEESGDQRR